MPFTRRTVAVVIALGIAAIASGAASSFASRPDQLAPAERSTLLARYMPVLYFHSEEEWSPVPVETFLRRTRVERQAPAGVWTTTTGAVPTSTAGCTLKLCYRFNLSCSLKQGDQCYEKLAPTLADWSRGYIYGRVVDVSAGTPSPPGVSVATRYLVRYWLFYPFDDWHSRRELLWQAHEADWETLSIGLDEQRHPLFAAYSQHCSGTVRPWTKVQRRATHPVAYVALGSHANYFTNNASPTKFVHCVYRNVSKANLAKARRLVNTVESGITDRTGVARTLGATTTSHPLQLLQLNPPLPDWARFPGRWSEGEYLWTGRTPTRFTRVSAGAGPATPNWQGAAIPSLWHSESS
jgi:hypothetical protein